MKIARLILRNVFRHKLRAALTILGVAIAVMAFGLLRTLVTSWYSGANAAAPRIGLLTRNSVSFYLSDAAGLSGPDSSGSRREERHLRKLVRRAIYR